MTADTFTRPTSNTQMLIASVVWAAVIIPAAWLSSSFLSIPGAFGASYFWLPMVFFITGAIWFGPYGWLAAAVGTFFGGMLAGSPLAINIAQNPIPAFLANTMLLWILFKGFNVKLDTGETSISATGRQIGQAVLVIVITIAIAMVVGYFTAPVLGRWGYALVLLVTFLGWPVLRSLGFTAVRFDRHTVLAIVAVILTSATSAAMGGVAWATIGGMGWEAAFTIVFPGWFLGDTVGGTFGVAVLMALHRTMLDRGLVWGGSLGFSSGS